MKKLLLFLSAVLLISCRQMDVISDTYWAVLSPRSTASSWGTRVKSYVHAYRIHFVTVRKTDGLEELFDVLRRDHPKTVLISPLLSLKIEELKKNFPAVHFYYYRFSGNNKVKSEKDTSVAIDGYSSIPYLQREKIAGKLIYLIMKKENRKNYEDINLGNIE